MSERRFAKRKLELVIASGFGVLLVVRKGKDVTAADVGTAAGVTAMAMAGILLQDRIVQKILSRGWLGAITGTTIAVEAIYIGGAVWSTYIDPEDGFQNYNEFIDLATSNPYHAKDVTLTSAAIVIQHAPEIREEMTQDWEGGIDEFVQRPTVINPTPKKRDVDPSVVGNNDPQEDTLYYKITNF